MDESGWAFNELFAVCRRVLPEVADQVQDEVARGQRLERSQLQKEDRDAREARMKEAKVGRKIGKDEQAVLPYTDDQRLGLLLAALERWIRVADASRDQLHRLAIQYKMRPVVRISNADEVDAETAVVRVSPPEERDALRGALRVLVEAHASVTGEDGRG